MNYISTKLFQHFASAYRNHNSKSDCYMLHGYSRDVYVEFGATVLDKQGFVVDFGALKEVKRWLNKNFDHVTVLQADDPLVGNFKMLEKNGALKLTLVPTVSAEGWACYIAKFIDNYVQEQTDNRAYVLSVDVRENSKNSGKYINRTNDGEVIDSFAFSDLIELVSDMQGLNSHE